MAHKILEELIGLRVVQYTSGTQGPDAYFFSIDLEMPNSEIKRWNGLDLFYDQVSPVQVTVTNASYQETPRKIGREGGTAVVKFTSDAYLLSMAGRERQGNYLKVEIGPKK